MIQNISFSIGKKLIVLVLLVSVTVLVIGAYLTFTYAEQILKEDAKQQLAAESAFRGEVIRNILNVRIIEMEALVRDHRVQESMAAISVSDGHSISRDVDVLTGVIQEFQDNKGTEIGISDINIVDENGMSYLGGENFDDSILFEDKMAGTFVDFERTRDGKIILIAAPINIDGVFLGALVGRMGADEIDQILLDRSGLGDTGETYIVNRDRLMVSESRFIDNAVFSKRVDTHPVVECFDNNAQVVGLYNDYRDIPIFGSSYCFDWFVLLTEIDESEVISPILTLQDRIIEAGIIIMLVMSALAFVLSRRISQPLVKLQKAANEIAGGNFGVRTEITTNDEIGKLSESFDAMSKKLEESLHEIRLSENVIKQQEEMLLNFSEESENSFVCLVDVKDSTKIAAGLSDEQTGRMYSTFLNFMADIVKKYDGTIVKNIGDALLFCFRRVESSDIDAFNNAVECCLGLLESRSRLGEELRSRDLPPIEFKISAAYGPVRIARISTSRVDDIFGSTVNRCAKINSAAPTNGLVVDETIRNILADSDRYVFEKLEDEWFRTEYGYSVFIIRRGS